MAGNGCTVVWVNKAWGLFLRETTTQEQLRGFFGVDQVVYGAAKGLGDSGGDVYAGDSLAAFVAVDRKIGDTSLLSQFLLGQPLGFSELLDIYHFTTSFYRFGNISIYPNGKLSIGKFNFLDIYFLPFG